MAPNQQRKTDLKLFAREIDALARDDISCHLNIISILGWGFDYPSPDISDMHPFLQLEKAVGSLKTFLEMRVSSVTVRHGLCLDVAEGIRHIHSCNIVHGDLKPDNVLVVENAIPRAPYMAKLADFGSSIDLNPPKDKPMTYRSYTGTPGWMPPEVYDNRIKQDESVSQQLFFKCDSYVYGLLVFSVFVHNGQQPYVPDRTEDWTNNIRTLEPLATVLRSKVSRLLSHEPDLRPHVSPELLCDDSETYRNW